MMLVYTDLTAFDQHYAVPVYFAFVQSVTCRSANVHMHGSGNFAVVRLCTTAFACLQLLWWKLPAASRDVGAVDR